MKQPLLDREWQCDLEAGRSQSQKVFIIIALRHIFVLMLDDQPNLRYKIMEEIRKRFKNLKSDTSKPGGKYSQPSRGLPIQDVVQCFDSYKDSLSRPAFLIYEQIKLAEPGSGDLSVTGEEMQDCYANGIWDNKSVDSCLKGKYSIWDNRPCAAMRTSALILVAIAVFTDVHSPIVAVIGAFLFLIWSYVECLNWSGDLRRSREAIEPAKNDLEKLPLMLEESTVAEEVPCPELDLKSRYGILAFLQADGSKWNGNSPVFECTIPDITIEGHTPLSRLEKNKRARKLQTDIKLGLTGDPITFIISLSLVEFSEILYRKMKQLPGPDPGKIDITAHCAQRRAVGGDTITFSPSLKLVLL